MIDAAATTAPSPACNAAWTFSRPGKGKGFGFYLVSLLLIFGFKGVVLMQGGQTYGRLMMPPVYDDVSYFIDAVQRMQIVLHQGLIALIQNLANDPPKAPYSTLAAMLSFMIGGPHLAAPYVMNVITLAALAAVLFRFARFGAWTTWTVGIMLVATKWFDNSVTIYHPDLIAGFATAIVAA